MKEIKAVKCIKIPYYPSEDVLNLLNDFRDMVNYCIRIGSEKNISSRFKLQNEAYYELKKSGYHSWYVLSAVEVATVILKNYRRNKRKNPKVKVPRAKRSIAKIGNKGYRIVNGWLRIPIKPRKYFYILLHKRAEKLLINCHYKLDSITLTAKAVYVSFSKPVIIKEPKSYVAINVNEDNITGVSSEGEVKFFNLSKLKKTGYGYFWRKKKLQQKYCRDRRIMNKAISKLFKNYNNKVSTILHQTSAAITKWCKDKRYGLIHKNIKGLQKSANKKTKRFNELKNKIQPISKYSKELKQRLNNWWFRKFLRQIAYKCLWEGINRVESKHTWGSSSTCPICGSKLVKYPNGQVKCKKRGFEGNRHVAVCLNLLIWEGVVCSQQPLKCSYEVFPNKALADGDKAWSKRGEVTSSVS